MGRVATYPVDAASSVPSNIALVVAAAVALPALPALAMARELDADAELAAADHAH